tara:strand:- start:57 stop:1772 length:1716 start_codon:yes stop_codon:yes gene_type:complete
MSFTISNFDTTQIQVDIPYTNKELLYCFIYIKLKENIYNKIDFLESITNNPHMMRVFKEAMFIVHPSDYNIIQLFIEDLGFNIIINNKLVDFLIVLFDSFSYDLLTQTITHILDQHRIKSQYLEASTTADMYFKKKEKQLVNLTYFMIEIFNRRFKDTDESIYKTFLINKIIYLFDIGIINFYEELDLRKRELDLIRNDLILSDSLAEIQILTEEKNDIINRRLVLTKLLHELFYSIEEFVDYLMIEFSKISNPDLYNIIYIYKKNNPFFYKNILQFINFSKLIMQSSTIKSKEFLIDYSNFYFELTLNSPNEMFLQQIADTEFLGTMCETGYNISKTDIDIRLFILNLSKIVSRIDNNIYILTLIRQPLITRLAYTLLDQIKPIIDQHKIEEVNVTLTLLEKINPEILVSFEIRNIYIETIFYLFDYIFKDNIVSSPKKGLALHVDHLIETLIFKNYNSIMNYFSSDISTLSKENWKKYLNYFNHDEYLFTNFHETIQIQLEYKNKQELTRDPICSSIIEFPVKIPDTDVYMDRYIISRCLMEKEENPFNRDKLTIEEINKYILNKNNNI